MHNTFSPSGPGAQIIRPKFNAGVELTLCRFGTNQEKYFKNLTSQFKLKCNNTGRGGDDPTLKRETAPVDYMYRLCTEDNLNVFRRDQLWTN